ncbi:hypothetical protein GT624_25875, partial [Enterobacter hormaechei]|nr:hypothetical protein [Enterobacter hormaechei]
MSCHDQFTANTGMSHPNGCKLMPGWIGGTWIRSVVQISMALLVWKRNGESNMPRTRRCRYPNCHAMVTFPEHYCQQHYEHEAEYLASRQR